MNEHRAASAPSRATGTINLQWGLVSVQLATFNASEGEARPLERHEYTADNHEVGRVAIDKVTQKPVERSAVVKKAASTSGHLVEITDEEIAAITGGRTTASEIEAFVPVAAFVDGTYMIESELQARPAPLRVGSKKLPNPAGDKAFALLTSIMAQRNVAALFKYAPGSAARYAALLPDGRILQVAWARQARATLPVPDVDISDAEKAMAEQLLDMVGVSTPVLVDQSFEPLQEYVDAKAAGTADAPNVEEATAQVIDLSEALAASLAAAMAANDQRAAEIVEAATGEPVIEAAEPAPKKKRAPKAKAAA